MSDDLFHGFYLEDLLIEPLTGKVTGRRHSEHLSPKAAEVLLRLAANSKELVTREQLLAEVWGEGKGSQEALSHAISAIRHALNDHANDPRFIQTLPRRGYRLIVDVQSKPSDPSNQSNGIIKPSNNPEFTDIGIFENLRERGVFETAIAYMLLGWLLIQIADIVFDQLHLPSWAGTFVTSLVIAGFPIAIVLSWFLEIREGRAVVHNSSNRDASRRQFSRTYIAVIGALTLAAAVVYVYDQSIGLPQAPKVTVRSNDNGAFLPPVLENSIAVLPFVNLDGSGETQTFASGLVDDVITRLSRVPGLYVSSRGDSFTLSANSTSSRVRERLRVSLYVEGSVQIEGDLMRVTVQLIDSATGFNVLSRSFDRPRKDFFAMRDDITELTVANVRLALPPDTREISKMLGDDPSLDVYVLYRRGIDASRLPRNINTIQTALNWFEAALEIDSQYAGAHAGKCEVYVNGYPVTDDPAYIDKAEASCAQALNLNPNLDIVHIALGKLYRATGRYDVAESAYLKALKINAGSVAAMTGLGTIYMLYKKSEDAESWFRQAIGLQPGDWSAYNALGYFLYRSGRYAEAVEQYKYVVALDESNMVGYTNLGTAQMLAGDFVAAATALQRATEIEPRAATYSNLGLMYYYQGQFDEAIEYHRQAVELAPNDHLTWSNLGDALWIAGHADEVKNVFETARILATRALQVNANDPSYLMDLAWIDAMLDNNDQARRLIERAHAQAPDDPYVHFISALIYLRNGDTDEALFALEAAAEKGYSVQMMAAEPHLTSLRNHPRFQDTIDPARSP